MERFAPRTWGRGTCGPLLIEAYHDGPGHLILHRTFTGPGDLNGQVTVLRADPVIWISADLIFLILTSRLGAPQLKIDKPDGPWDPGSPGVALTWACMVGARPWTLTGWRLRIAGDQPLLYVTGEHRDRPTPPGGVYEMAWPD